MLAKHSVTYFLGRGLPGLLNFAALSIYTRLVMPADYGSYALVIATVNLFNAIFFQWIRLVLLRFTATCPMPIDKDRLNTTVILGYAVSLLVSFLVLAIVLGVRGQPVQTEFLVLGIGLLITQALFEIGLDGFRSNLQPAQYAKAHFAKSALAVLLGSVLAYMGFGAAGLLLGVLVASTVAMIVFFRTFLSELSKGLQPIDWLLVRRHLMYGLPLTASSALSFIMDSSDRYLVNYYLGSASTGAYSVGYDLAKQTLWVLMTSISLASYPLVIRALEQEGSLVANRYLKSNFILLLAIALPTAVGMSLLAAPLARLVVGPQYIASVTLLIPYVAIGALFSGLKSFYFDQSFQLAQKTRLQLWSVGAAALLNVVLNILLIPAVGLMGAAYATLISYATVLAVSFTLARHAYRLPVPWPEIRRVALATTVMACLLLAGRPYIHEHWHLGGLITLGILLYGGILFVLGVINSHTIQQSFSTRKKGKNVVEDYA